MEPESQGPRPEVYARLAHDARAQASQRTPPRAARVIGWVLVAATIAVVVLAALRTGI